MLHGAADGALQHGALPQHNAHAVPLAKHRSAAGVDSLHAADGRAFGLDQAVVQLGMLLHRQLPLHIVGSEGCTGSCVGPWGTAVVRITSWG